MAEHLADHILVVKRTVGTENSRNSSDSAADLARSVDVFHNERPRIFVGTEGDSEGLLAIREGRNQLRKTDFERKRDTSASRGAFLMGTSVRRTKSNLRATCRKDGSA